MALPDGIFPEARLLLYGGPCDGMGVHCANAENQPAEFRMPLTPLDPSGPEGTYRWVRKVRTEGRVVVWRYEYDLAGLTPRRDDEARP